MSDTLYFTSEVRRNSHCVRAMLRKHWYSNTIDRSISYIPYGLFCNCIAAPILLKQCKRDLCLIIRCCTDVLRWQTPVEHFVFADLIHPIYGHMVGCNYPSNLTNIVHWRSATAAKPVMCRPALVKWIEHLLPGKGQRFESNILWALWSPT